MLKAIIQSRFVKYCVVGFVGVFIDASMFFLLNKVAGTSYLIAHLLSAHAGMLNNFFMNSFFTFKATDRQWQRFLSYYLIALGGMLTGSLLLKLLIEGYNVDAFISKLISLGLITLVQFSLNKRLTYKSSTHEKSVIAKCPGAGVQ